MSVSQERHYSIALVEWEEGGNGIGEAIYHELIGLGHCPTYFRVGSTIPDNVEVLFLYGPFGKYLSALRQLEYIPAEQRPTVVFWNTEGLPDPKIPWPIVNTISTCRSQIGQFEASDKTWLRSLADKPPLSLLETGLTRFRYLGDFFYAKKKGWLDVFADISAVYAEFFNKRGLPTIVAPFGAFSDWYADLDLERDIDVLWMGKRATKRRSRMLDQLREKLSVQEVKIHMVDNVENPFVFDEERTHLLNRTKITLNLLRTWYDENTLRICMAAPNRSLVVSEPLLAHVPHYEAGIHYASAPTIDKLAETILYYLEHTDERLRIVENAYQLLTTTLTMGNSIKTIMEAVNKARIVAVGQE